MNDMVKIIKFAFQKDASTISLLCKMLFITAFNYKKKKKFYLNNKLDNFNQKIKKNSSDRHNVLSIVKSYYPTTSRNFSNTIKF